MDQPVAIQPAELKPAKRKKLRKYNIGTFYKVTWHDIVTDRGWKSIGSEKLTPAKCTTYGWAIEASNKSVTLSATRGDNEDGSDVEYNQHIAIPIGCIWESEVIKLGA